MNRKTFFRLLSCTMFSLLVVTALFTISNSTVSRHGWFYRKFPPHLISGNKEIMLPHNSYYIAGFSHGSLFLANITAPLQLMEINDSFDDTTSIRLKIDNAEGLKFFSINVKIDSPYFNFSDGAVPYIYRGVVGEWYAKPHIDSIYFLDLVPLGASTYAARSLNSLNSENILGKIVRGSLKLETNTALLEKQVDGVFCTDGMLHYDRLANRLVYVYYYRNEFIIADSNLVLSNRGRTIDTTSHVQIKTATLSLDGHLSNQIASPPPTINKHSHVSGNWLFIHSPVMALNEHKEEFNNGSVIDVYDLTKIRYAFSFYLNSAGQEKVKGLAVKNGMLYAIYDHSIQRYVLNDKFFSMNK